MFEGIMLILKKNGFEIPVEIENFAKTLNQISNTVNSLAKNVQDSKYKLYGIICTIKEVKDKNAPAAKHTFC